MAMAKSIAVTVFPIVALFGAAMAAEYTVGDSAGWTTMGNIDYKKWADGKQFHVGDSLVFKYNNKFHDVKQVSQQDFESCSSASPIASYASGSDSIPLKSAGHHYFLCGFQGHCQAGQKVDIMVSSGPGGAPSASPSESPASAPSHSAGTLASKTNSSSSSSSSSAAPTPSPSTSSAKSLYNSQALLVSSALAFFMAGFGF